MSNKMRTAHKGEIEEIMELIAKCVQVMQDGGSDQWDASYPNKEIIGLDIERGTLYVCEDNSAIAGIIVLDENQAEEYKAIRWSQNQGPHLVMHRLAVHPEIQGKGIARQLIAFAEDYAERSGYTSIRLDTYAKNSRALWLYPSLGYDRRGEVNFPGRTASFPVFEKVLGATKDHGQIQSR
jgi:ribosomal protein S18 acetylase RimI-like enzyme